MIDLVNEPSVYEKVINEKDNQQIRLVINTFRGVEYLSLRKYYLDFEENWLPSPAVMIAGYRVDMSASQCPPAFFNAAAPICDISGAYHRIHRLLLQPTQCLLQASVFAVNVPYNADFLNHLVPRRFPYLVRTPCRLVSERGVNYPSATNPFQPFIYSINVSLSPS